MADMTGLSRLFVRFSLCMGLRKPPANLPKTNLKRSEEITDFKKYNWPGKKSPKKDTAKADRDTVGESRIHDKNPDKE